MSTARRALTVALVAGCVALSACEDEKKGTTALSLTTLIDACNTFDTCYLGQGDLKYMCLYSYLTYFSRASDISSVNSYYDCMANAGSCVEAVACQSTECAEQDPACQGNTLVLCWMGSLIRYDCSRDGKRCLLDSDGWGTCADETCTEAQEGIWCEDDQQVVCSYGLLMRNDCGRYSPHGTCHETDGDAVCVDDPVTSCDPETFNARCEGNIVVACDPETGLVASLDCSTLTPFEIACEGGQCRLPGPSCGELEEAECRCQGSVLSCCMVGMLEEFDCASLGLSCTVEDDEGDLIYYCGEGVETD